MISPRISAAAVTSQPVRISDHAIQRYQERVDPAASAAVTVGAIRQILSAGTALTEPRHWTTCRVEPGTKFVYAFDRADLCLVVRNSTVVTVLTVDLCARDRASYVPIPQRPRSWQQRLEDDADIYEPLPDDLAWVA